MTYRTYYDDDAVVDRIECWTLSDTRPVAKKEHTCGGCKRTIPIGQRYRRRFMLIDGDPWFEKTCRECQWEQP